MPGAARLLAELAAHEVPTALVSASHRRIIDRVLPSLGPEHFALSVAGDEVARTKPHPDPYLLAAAGLGADPARCAVIEDTATGVAAAEAAGCRVVAVPSVAPIAPAARRTVVALPGRGRPAVSARPDDGQCADALTERAPTAGIARATLVAERRARECVPVRRRPNSGLAEPR